MKTDADKRYAGTAAVLSFVFTGIGQIYNGQIKKGLFLIGVATFGLTLALLGALAIGISILNDFYSFNILISSALALLVGCGIIIWSGIYSIYDAYNSAMKED